MPPRASGLSWRRSWTYARPRSGVPVNLYQSGVVINLKFAGSPDELRAGIGGTDADYDAYLRAHPAPKQPAELAQHAVLVPGQLITELRLHRGRTQAQVALTPRLIVTDPAVVHAATAAGAGIGVLPEFLCRQGLAMNKLERVLPEWQVADLLELHAVCDLRRARAPAVKALIEFFVANMVPVLGKG